MNPISIFKNSKFGEIRTVNVEDKIYFVGVDVARALGYVHPSKAVRQHCKGMTKSVIPSGRGRQDTNIISEGDVYRLVIKSELPAAEEFERWVFDEVLPTIRKEGSYSTAPVPTQPDTQLIPQELQMFKLLYDGMVNQATKVNELEQKVDRLILIEESHIVPPVHEKPSILELEVMQNIMKKDMVSTTQIGARYGLSSTNFYKLLHKLGLVAPDTDRKGWLLSEIYRNKGIGTNGQSQSGDNSYSYVLWTPKGRTLIEDTLKDNGLMPTKRLAPKRRKKKNR